MLYASEHPLVRLKLAKLRDVQTRPSRFRELVHEVSMLLGYEALRSLPLAPKTVRTPLADAPGHELAVSVGLVPILRAGLGMVDAFLTLVPTAEVWHLGLYRDEETLKPIEYYNRLSPQKPPSGDEVQVWILLDPIWRRAARPLRRWTCCAGAGADRSPTSGWSRRRTASRRSRRPTQTWTSTSVPSTAT